MLNIQKASLQKITGLMLFCEKLEGTRIAAVGSQLVNQVVPSDYDFLIYPKSVANYKLIQNYLINERWAIETHSYTKKQGSDKFDNYRFGKLNVILLNPEEADETYFKRFAMASKLAGLFGATNKSDRVYIHDLLLERHPPF